MFSRLLLFCTLIGSVALTSCDIEGLDINKDFDGATITLDVPASEAAGPVAIKQEGIETGLKQSLKEFEISEDQLRQVVVKTVSAKMIDPSEDFDFSNLKDVTLKFSSEELGESILASLDQGSGTEATFEISDSDLKDFLLSEKFDAILVGTSDQGIGENVKAEVSVTYAITAGL